MKQRWREVAARNNDVESQVFYALALLANAPPTDKTHARQKKAADILEPLYAANPEHPGIPHYLIHAYDNAELAFAGFAGGSSVCQRSRLPRPTRCTCRAISSPGLGLWDDLHRVESCGRRRGEEAGDTGEQLHAMDYLVYAYLQSGRD